MACWRPFFRGGSARSSVPDPPEAAACCWLFSLAPPRGAGWWRSWMLPTRSIPCRTAARAGLDLRALLWVRCGGRPASAWSAVDLLARCTGFAAIALDLGSAGSTGAPALGTRLQRAAEGGGAAVIVRTPRHLLGAAAALVVSVRRVRTRWMGADGPTRLGGLVSEARVLRSRADPRLAAPERAWVIEWRA